MPTIARPQTLLNPWRLAGWGFAGLILLLPAAAMQFTAEVNWGPGDFVAAAALLGLTGLAIEGAVRIVRTPLRRAVLVAGVLALLLVVWAELAVGMF